MLKKYTRTWHSALHIRKSTIAWQFKILTIFKFRGISTYMLKKYILAWHSALHIKYLQLRGISTYTLTFIKFRGISTYMLKKYTLAWHSVLRIKNSTIACHSNLHTNNF